MRKPGGGLTEMGAREVLRLRSGGASYAAIANAIEISMGTVHNVVVGRPWAWLREEIMNEQDIERFVVESA